MRFRIPAAAALALLLFVSPGCDSLGSGDEVEVRVMSQNLYLGADLFVVAGEQDPNRIPIRVAQFYNTVQQSAVQARMEAIAAEIADIRPALVGLQEVSTYYVQSPSDYVTGTTAPNATEVTFDFLELLLEALEAEGADYEVASVSNNSDVELPATSDGQTFFDVRYQDADVILRRSDVTVTSATEAQFNTVLTVPVGGVNRTYQRGYQSVRATVDGLTFTFFNTHLEVGGQAAPVQQAQAVELADVLAQTTGPLVLVGDLNSPADGSGTTSYATITASLTDVYGSAGPATCCQAPDIRNEESELETRIDFVLYRGFDEVNEVGTIFTDPSDRITGGIWPSDHAGVWAELEAEVAAEAS